MPKNAGRTITRIITITIPIGFLFFFLSGQLVHSAGKYQVDALEDLWIDMRIGPPLIPLFNTMARPDDMARVDHPNQIGQLNATTEGKKLVVFKSVAEAEELLGDVASEIDIVGYNFESGPGTPPGDLADPVGSIQAMRELADSYDLDLFFGPDHDFALSHGVEMAPYADYFVLQIQRQQTNPPIVEDFVVPLVPKLREANPDLQISVQVRTEGDIDALVALLDSLKEHLDGISILTSPDTVDTAEELVVALRPDVTPPPREGEGSTMYLPIAIGGAAVAAGAYLIYRRQQSPKTTAE